MNPMNYDAWFDYLRLMEADGNMEQIRETYERAIANVPPSKVGACSVAFQFLLLLNLKTCLFDNDGQNNVGRFIPIIQINLIIIMKNFSRHSSHGHHGSKRHALAQHAHSWFEACKQ